ncbi:conserved hypothetical protein [Candidatus Accumulibacter aalborgensis]|uniref:DUF29 domain-containing protein n=1 Tax=Candidatus Accumulibacter aalborgensis TaxID=1860102 RepID=A0A1A8XPG8_9PROT|nr:DUF29 domain-containing protein [Candidatus Accumulibacter aalborgensis]SBT05833.1 conserved hypothetical protein [Candidatus Accumulibacter aalborgensis]
MSTSYEADVVAWANEQAEFIRAGRFDLLDREHIAEEIEDVGKSEQRELASRMAVLVAHLLKWQCQPGRRGSSWESTIRIQRKEIFWFLKDAPSLAGRLRDPMWIDRFWSNGVAQVITETGLDCFPDACPWSIEGEVLKDGWLPDA